MTTSTEVLQNTIRTRLLTFQALGSPTPQTLTDILSGLYWVQGPATAVFPYGILRLDPRTTSGAYAGEREETDCELQIFGRPQSMQATVEGAADIADQAMLRWVDSTGGVVFASDRERGTLPTFAPPADREVVAVRCVYHLKVWPQFLTQYSLAG